VTNDVEVIRSLYGYSNWATDRLLALAVPLPAERTRERLGAGYDSIHSTLGHLLGAEVVWLSRWRGVSPSSVLTGADFDDLGTLTQRWATHKADQTAFLAALTPAQLAATVHYTNLAGQAFAYPLWQMMVHVANHGTHHRSELAEMLTRLGSPPPDTDLLVYYGELGQK
jgi:uncharacterized damage-inducible protein DinB